MLQIQCLESRTKEVNNIFSRFAVGPLKKGQGLTIGNALRRVLLSDLQGLAIAGVRIADVSHEFSTIQDVKEDVIDILLNLKQISLKGNIDEPTLSRLTYHGPGIITAKDIELPTEIELIEPNQYIASVNTSKTVEMEFLIQSGEGYTLNTKNQLSDGFLPIDAVYMPVKKVNFFIETSSDTVASNLETLILEVYTNGSINPMEALSSASELLQNIFKSLQVSDLPKQLSPIVDNNILNKNQDNNSEFDNVMIEELELSVRAYNCLKRASIHTLPDLLKYSQEDLLEFKNFGQKSADEVCLSLKTKFGKDL
jgi:DNA-directed RNA polymerase subunit alpha|tara:strand:- start:5892 stop:6824 length:933 start_codon:yes stop_codon:yes gene_type:complete